MVCCRCDDEGVDLVLHEHQGGRQRGLMQRGLTPKNHRGRADAAVRARDRARADCGKGPRQQLHSMSSIFLYIRIILNGTHRLYYNYYDNAEARKSCIIFFNAIVIYQGFNVICFKILMRILVLVPRINWGNACLFPRYNVMIVLIILRLKYFIDIEITDLSSLVFNVFKVSIHLLSNIIRIRRR